MQLFTQDPQELQAGLFAQTKVRQGVTTVLNINFLPDLLQFVRGRLNADEVLRLQEYHLQNYLIELSLSYSGKERLEDLVEHILVHIKGSNNFWYRHNNMEVINEEQELKHRAIRAYHTDLKVLKQKFKEDQGEFQSFEPKYPQRTSEGFCYRLLHQSSDPNFGTRHCLNHIAYVPAFLFERSSLINKKEEQNNPDQPQQRNNVQFLPEQRKILEECILYILANKTSKQKVDPKLASASSGKDQVLSESDSDKNEGSGVEGGDTILEEFLKYIQRAQNIPVFENSHHMYDLTLNVLKIGEKVMEKSLKKDHKVEVKREKNFLTGDCNGNKIENIGFKNEIIEILSKLSDSQLEDQQIEIVSDAFMELWEQSLKQILEGFDIKNKASNNGWLNSQAQMNQVRQQYQQLLADPQFIELNQYRAAGSNVPWKEQEYLKFLKGLYEYINVPTNNKRIASFMGSKIQSNHVKNVKCLYLSVMKERMDRGQCGGGKRGKCLSKAEFLQKDIATFSMKWFQKSKKIRKRKVKRRRRMSESEDEEIDSDF